MKPIAWAIKERIADDDEYTDPWAGIYCNPDTAKDDANVLESTCTSRFDVEPLYGPDLLDYADRMREERDAERDRGDQWEITATNLLNRAETAERQLAELQAKHDALVKRLREPVNKRDLSRDLTEIVAQQLHYLEHIHGKAEFKTAAEVSEAVDGGLRRYATDYVFRAKVTSTVASIISVVDAAMSAVALDKGDE